MKLAGVDGCSTGWVVASWHDGVSSPAVTIHLAKTFREVVDAGYQVIAVDVPIRNDLDRREVAFSGRS